jgi:ribosomal protein S8
MPEFYVEDIDIDPDEFVSSCSSEEVQELIDILVEDGYINKKDVISTEKSILDEEWDEVIGKLEGRGRLHLTNEEEEIIRKIANRL